MGPYAGGQAQFVRVPFADFNCLKLPDNTPEELEKDFLMLADIFPTAYHATELAQVGLGKTVAIYGAGPVGLLSAMSCQLKGASEVYVVDNVEARLEKAKEIGAVPINFSHGDPVEKIKDIRKHNKRLVSALRPGEEKAGGIMCGIDAVGYQCHDETHRDEERSNQIINDMAKLLNPGGAYGVIGVFMPKDPGGKSKEEQNGVFPLPYGQLWEKGIAIGTGQAPVKRYNTQLRDIIIAGKANPGMIISHELPIDAAPDAYEMFDQRADGYTKVILKPNGHM
jgi:glutathione-independent formaldehyde dehydrogenase